MKTKIGMYQGLNPNLRIAKEEYRNATYFRWWRFYLKIEKSLDLNGVRMKHTKNLESL